VVADISLVEQRRVGWRQTPQTRITGPDDAVELIERAGVVTLFPASPEAPNLFHAFMGDPAARTDSGHDSPSGEVYTWRWVLGRREAAFYSVLVRARPTLVSWAMLPAVLRLWGEMRTPDELYDLGAISPAAYRIAQALDEAGGVMSTGELRQAARFPAGKAERAAYLKAVDELDRRLLLAKVFAEDGDDMRHALVALRYPDHVAAAEALSREEALQALLAAYMPAAAYAAPTLLAKHLRLPEAELRAALDRLAGEGRVAPVEIEGYSGACYAWIGRSS
jgi:hypothetical protein